MHRGSNLGVINIFFHYIVWGHVPWLLPILAGWVYGYVLLFFCPGAPEGSAAVVLVLKRLRRRGHGLKSHPTDWRFPVIFPANFQKSV